MQNVAHGSFYMFGAYIAFGLLEALSSQIVAIFWPSAPGVIRRALQAFLIERVRTDSLR